MANRLPLTNADGEVRELEAEDFKNFRPAAEVLPEIMGEALAAEMLQPKQAKSAKVSQTTNFTDITLDPDVMEAFISTGVGWQKRINAALREWLQSHGA